MKLGVLFSGGKDSMYAAWLAQKEGHKLVCLITLSSKNPNSYMFHTPSISKTQKQADAMGIPIITRETKGKKEDELHDLEEAIKEAKKKYKIEGVITGAVESGPRFDGVPHLQGRAAVAGASGGIVAGVHQRAMPGLRWRGAGGGRSGGDEAFAHDRLRILPRPGNRHFARRDRRAQLSQMPGRQAAGR